MDDWQIDPDGIAEEHWVDLMYKPAATERDEWFCWKYASVKWDGCIHFSQAGNVPFEKYYGTAKSAKRHEAACDDDIHICDIDEMIEALVSLKAFAMEYFKNREDDYWKEKVKE
jgi:hypothetical protein